MKKILVIFITSLLALTLLGTISVQAAGANLSRVEDYADLLDPAAENQVREKLDELSEKLQFDIVVVTTNSTGGKSSQAYADDFYDYNGYGWGDNYDGVLLLINMEYREWHISTTGYGMQAVTNSEIDYIGDAVVDYLSWGDYELAFTEFADLIADEVKEERDSEHIDLGEVIVRIVIALVIGMVLAFIPVSIMKKQMNNVQVRQEASDYMKRNQVRMTQQKDLFLYSNISRRLKPQDSGNRSGGGGHIGSSGRSHGGGGGRF